METTEFAGSRTESEIATSRGPVLRRLRVDGMDCRSCENLLVETLGRQPGVGAVSADARTGMVSVLADPAVFTDVDIARIIVARMLLRSIFKMLKDKVRFNHPGLFTNLRSVA